jgi:hypothetical protein
MQHKIFILKSLDRNLLKQHIMLSEYEIGESLEIPLQSAILLGISTFTWRIICDKSNQHYIINANFLQMSLAIVQSLKEVDFQMNPLNDHPNGRC